MALPVGEKGVCVCVRVLANAALAQPLPAAMPLPLPPCRLLQLLNGTSGQSEHRVRAGACAGELRAVLLPFAQAQAQAAAAARAAAECATDAMLLGLGMNQLPGWQQAGWLRCRVACSTAGLQ